MEIKCVVWDLDETLWAGTLAEGEVTLRAEVHALVRSLDERGILQSIASRSEAGVALKQLQTLGLDEYFLYPQIQWGSKSASIQRIAQELNLNVDAIVLVDDQAFERDEARSQLPALRCFENATQLVEALGPPRPVTEESRVRRRLYQSEAVRKHAEALFPGPPDEFLSTLGLELSIRRTVEEELQRAEELTVRTHQLNATGYTYSLDELSAFCRSDTHRLLSARLRDRYGNYGHIGLVLIEMTATVWTLKLLIMSCRVMSRGVGGFMLAHVLAEAAKAGVRLQAEYVPTDKNRVMYITYKFAGFREAAERDGVMLLEHELATLPALPAYLRLESEW